MKRLFLLVVVAFAIVPFVMGQGIMYIEYNDGRCVKEELENVKKISFHHLDELPEDPIILDINRGLLAYYTFDSESVNDSQNRYNGFLSGGAYVSDTPSGYGKALFLKRGEQVTIPFSAFNGLKNYSVSFWVKDFGAGSIFQTFNGYLYGPSLYITEGICARLFTGVSWSSDNYVDFATNLAQYQSEKWTMVTVVTSTEKNSSRGNSSLYINGQLMESSISYTNNNSDAVCMSIGGYAWGWTDPMKVDNVRLYDVALTQEEVTAIYEKEKQPVILNITPQKLYFDKYTNKQTILLKNNTLRLVDYKISSNIESLSISSQNSYIIAKESKVVDIAITDRDKIESYISGAITIEIEGMYYSLDVQIEKGIEAPDVSDEVSRGLQAYYKFDNETISDSRNGYDGTLEGGHFDIDTPQGSGKALFLKRGEYATIAYAPLEGKKNYSVSFWIKDFGAGFPFRCYSDNYNYGPSIQITEETKVRFYTGVSWSSDNYVTFGTDLKNYQSDKWTMITIVTHTEGNSSKGISRLYINGQPVSTSVSYTNNNSGAISMSIGKGATDPFKIDNIRLYSVALDDHEVVELYNAERK